MLTVLGIKWIAVLVAVVPGFEHRLTWATSERMGLGPLLELASESPS